MYEIPFNITTVSNFTVECLGEQEEWVYDIEVEDNHNFFGNNILVHNSNYIELNQVVNKNSWDSLSNSEITAKLDTFCKEKLQPVINKAFADLLAYLNHRVSVLDMNRENIASRAIWTTAKKRYAMLVYDSEGDKYDPPKPKIQGMEAVKNSTPRTLRSLLKDATLIMLTEDEPALQAFVRKKEAEFKGFSFEDVSYNKYCNSLANYASEATIYKKGCPINTRAALVYNHMLKKHKLERTYPLIKEGDKIKFTFLTVPNPAASDIFAAPYELPPELHLEEFIDYRKIFEKAFIKPLSSLTDAVGWTVEAIPDMEDLFEY